LKQTNKTIEELRENRLVIAPECCRIETIEKTDDDGNKVIEEVGREYCKKSAMIKNRKRCTVYAFPKSKWRNGQICSFATHVERETETTTKGKARVGQQKQKKKSRR
jgi:hypothetical protein